MSKDKNIIKFAKFVCESLSYDVELDSFYTDESIKDLEIRSKSFKNKLEKISCFANISNELFRDNDGLYKVNNDLIGISVADFINIVIIGYGSIEAYYKEKIFHGFINFPFVGDNKKSVADYKADLDWILKSDKHLKTNLEWLKYELNYWYEEAGRNFLENWGKLEVEITRILS